MEGSPQVIAVFAIAISASVASVAGGALALLRKPTTLLMSSVLGFAGGVLIATIGFEMLPKALELGSLPIAVGGFIAGLIIVYAWDLFIHRGQIAGAQAEQRQRVEQFHRRRRPRGTEVTVLAGGTSAEELIEGLSIGVGAGIDPSVGLLVGVAIAIDNLSEGMSIGELVLAESSPSRSQQRRRIFKWTGIIGAAVLVSTLVGWFALRGLGDPLLGFLLAAGAGGMFYLTVSNLVPEAEERHYEQSGAVSIALGFVLILVLSQLH